MSTMDKAEVMARVMADVVKRHVADAVSPLYARIKELESRPLAKDGRDGVSVSGGLINEDGVLILTLSDGAVKDAGRVRGKDGKDGLNGKDGKDGIAGKDGTNGRDGIDGKSVDPEALDKLIAVAVAKIPTPKNGRDGVDGKDGSDGIDGKSVSIDEVSPLIVSEVEKAVSKIPAPANGKDGRDGIDGKDGRDGLDGKDGAAGLPGERGEKGLDGKDGRDGLNGKDGKDGLPGERGEKGERGEDGRDANPVEIAKLLLPEVEKAVAQIPRIKGEKGDPGEPGKDGRDGRDGAPGGPPGPQGEKGEPGKSIVYLGVYEAGLKAQEGNAATFGGSLWIAKRDTDQKPGDGDDWQLAVKRGRDGKDRTTAR